MSKEEKTTALAVSPVSGYVAVVQGVAAMKEVVEENLGGDQLRLARVKVPSGGGISWEIPSTTGAVSAPAIEGVIVAQRNIKVFYASAFTGGNEPPDCASPDAIRGTGTPIPGGNPGTFACAKCPNNQFGTSKKADGSAGRGKICQDKKLLYILLQDRLLPIEIVVPAGSLKNVSEYLSNLSAEGKPLSRVVTKLTLRKEKSGDGITYSQIVPEKAGEITAEQEVALLREYGATIREIVKKMVIDGEYADAPEGGDAFGQTSQDA